MALFIFRIVSLNVALIFIYVIDDAKEISGIRPQERCETTVKYTIIHKTNLLLWS